jgi:NAD(P)-dependent dehydrogenase (short-subunit alcohol dehydrogenase family)
MAGTLSGKTAVVIGASSGIGLSTANLLSDSGTTVHAAARRKSTIEQGVEGRAVSAHELDISDEGSVRRMLEGIGEGDGIDVLVVAAGMNFPERRLEQLTGESWDAMISVNLSGAFYAIRAALPYLRASRGLVVLVSSVSGSWPDASGPAYQASKAGMTQLAHAAGFEEHQNGVRFTAVLPGIVDTPILDNSARAGLRAGADDGPDAASGAREELDRDAAPAGRGVGDAPSRGYRRGTVRLCPGVSLWRITVVRAGGSGRRTGLPGLPGSTRPRCIWSGL